MGEALYKERANFLSEIDLSQSSFHQGAGGLEEDRVEGLKEGEEKRDDKRGVLEELFLFLFKFLFEVLLLFLL